MFLMISHVRWTFFYIFYISYLCVIIVKCDQSVPHTSVRGPEPPSLSVFRDLPSCFGKTAQPLSQHTHRHTHTYTHILGPVHQPNNENNNNNVQITGRLLYFKASFSSISTLWTMSSVRSPALCCPTVHLCITHNALGDTSGFIKVPFRWVCKEIKCKS